MSRILRACTCASAFALVSLGLGHGVLAQPAQTI